MTDPIKVEDFKKLAPLVKAYELKPDHSYVFICGPKSFSYEGAHALFKDVREHHPNIHVFIVATTKPNDIEVGEKIGEEK